MKIVFKLRDELRNHLDHVCETRRDTVDPSKPATGLSGRYGLFGSLEWWGNVAQEKMPLQRVSGTVEAVHVAGTDEAVVQAVDVRSADGKVQRIEVRARCEPGAAPLLVAGDTVSILCALDELKRQPAPDGGLNVARIALEIAVPAVPAAAPAGVGSTQASTGSAELHRSGK
ncbi:hypothetical protein HH212_05075 [Massilia forsythiae]|uniref:Uncharacterized protein n=1 Tax=Massilia forsythiae TaxID=2728020 RepID=A0A7Z2ZRU0_9BURK|nr:hypothetical protein [Massilia forsythiae]QJD99469.1 hypothetical protein HH212_05075 [Massilia forsythiae]